MIQQDLFATPVYRKNCNIDLKRLEQKCLQHAVEMETAQKSNVGGYQGHNFYDKELFEEIAQSLPIREDNPIENVTIFAWVNINGQGDYNERHHHDPLSGTFMSGVFYVKVPKNSGQIRLYDPRPSILLKTKDMMYYNNGFTYHYYDPEDNFMLMFPSWLEHSVEANKSEEKRISIAFNIMADV